jgi:hypothetical protein
MTSDNAACGQRWSSVRDRWNDQGQISAGAVSVRERVGGPAYHAIMPTLLTFDQHLAALRSSAAALRAAAASAGLDAKVPTCPAWDIRQLVTHQGMVHRWAAASLRQERDHKTSESHARGRGRARPAGVVLGRRGRADRYGVGDR